MPVSRFFRKWPKLTKIGKKRQKNGIFSTVFGNFDPEESGITPTSPTYIDSVGENGTFETYLTEFPVGGCWGVRKNWFLGIEGTLCNTKTGDFCTYFLVIFGWNSSYFDFIQSKTAVSSDYRYLESQTIEFLRVCSVFFKKKSEISKYSLPVDSPFCPTVRSLDR